MKLNRKWILVMSLVLSVALATGSTLAYMTATTQTLTNTFTLGDVSITLTENFVQNSPMYPGTPVAKDPTITNTGKTPAWVWMKVEMPADVYPYIKLNTIDTAAWKVVEDEANGVMTILYNTTLAANGTATPFTAVELAADADLDDIESFNMDITAYAIQDKPFTNVDDAYAAFYSDEVADTQQEAQEMLDNAVSGTVIRLAPGVHYGTLEVRANVGFDENGEPIAANANTTQVDYFTDKYPTGEYLRKFENVTIIGTEGATVDAIVFANGTFKATNPANNKQTGTMYRFVEVKNFAINGVEFTDHTTVTPDNNWYSPLLINLTGVKVDGLTVSNCKLQGTNNKINFVYAYGAPNSAFTEPALKNIKLINNNVSGIARLCELREAENVTINNNIAANLTREFALLANNPDKAYSGNITVNGNTADAIAADYMADGQAGLFFRVGVGGNAKIVVKNNVITDSDCVADSFVKVTNHTGILTVEANSFE